MTRRSEFRQYPDTTLVTLTYTTRFAQGNSTGLKRRQNLLVPGCQLGEDVVD